MILLASLVTDELPNPILFGVACLWVSLCAAVAALVKLQWKDKK